MVTRHKIDGKKIEVNKTIIQKEILTEKANLDLVNAEMQFNIANTTIATVSTQIELAKKIYHKPTAKSTRYGKHYRFVAGRQFTARSSAKLHCGIKNLRRAELEYKRVQET